MFVRRCPTLLRRRFSTVPPHVPIPMPMLSPTMTVGTISKWHVKEGDRIQPEQIIFDLETNGLTEDGGTHVMEIEAHEEGVLAKILVPAGTAAIPIHAVIGVMSESDAPDLVPSRHTVPSSCVLRSW